MTSLAMLSSGRFYGPQELAPLAKIGKLETKRCCRKVLKVCKVRQMAEDEVFLTIAASVLLGVARAIKHPR